MAPAGDHPHRSVPSLPRALLRPTGGCRLGRSSSQPHTPEAAPQLWEAGGGEHAALTEAPAPHWVPRRFQLCPADLREHLEHPRAGPERCWAAAGSGRCGEELQQSFVVVLVTQQADGGEFLVFQCAGLVRRSPSTSRPVEERQEEPMAVTVLSCSVGCSSSSCGC